MSNLDKKYSLRLDLRINFTNSTMKFDEFDINTSDFFIKVTRNKELIDISEAIVTLVAIKPDGAVESQFVTITENNVYCDLKPSMKDIPGKYEAIASITINGETINTDPTNPIIYEVTENKFLRKLDAAVVSEERFSILTDMINKLSVIENQENDREKAEKLREENAKKAITELNNIAKNFDNTVIEKVKEKVDEVIEPALNEKLPSIVSNKIESIKNEIKGEQGDKGDKGDKGATGQKGEQGERGEQGLPGNDGQDGENGITPNIQIGNVTTLEPNQQATVVNVGTLENPVFDFGIPKGEDGEGGKNDTLVTTKIVDGTLTLTTDKYQTTTMQNNTTIVLPTVDTFTEIHLFFSATEDLTLTLPKVKWQNEPTIENGKTYEFIFTYTTEYLGGCVVYE